VKAAALSLLVAAAAGQANAQSCQADIECSGGQRCAAGVCQEPEASFGVESPPHAQTIFRLDAAATYRRIYDVSVYGGEITLSGASERVAPIAVVWGLTFFSGQRQFGLSAMSVAFSCVVERRIGRFRLGGGGALSELFYSRATSSDYTYSPAIGAEVRASYDLLQLDEMTLGAVYLLAKMRADFVFPSTSDNTGSSLSIVWGPTLGAGVRF